MNYASPFVKFATAPFVKVKTGSAWGTSWIFVEQFLKGCSTRSKNSGMQTLTGTSPSTRKFAEAVKRRSNLNGTYDGAAPARRESECPQGVSAEAEDKLLYARRRKFVFMTNSSARRIIRIWLATWRRPAPIGLIWPKSGNCRGPGGHHLSVHQL